jgi:uncharacterized protein YsxB (DUF464 family)
MIRINYCRDVDWHRLSVTGHAGYAEAGKDIVCAGVSAITFALLGYLNQEANVECQYSDGEISVDCVGGENVKAAFSMALAGYTQMAEEYPKHVAVYIASQGC